MSTPCQVIERGRRVALCSSSFALWLNLSGRLRVESWENRLTGRWLVLRDGTEFSCSVDSAKHRIDFPGWRLKEGGPETRSPREDIGAREKWFDPFFNDSPWCGEMTGYSRLIPSMLSRDYETNPSARRYLWARSHFVLPGNAEGKLVSIVLGGYGLGDFNFMRVFLNGAEIGVRRVSGAWREPARFRIERRDRHYRLLRFAQDNVLALQLKEWFTRSEALEKVYPLRAFTMNLDIHVQMVPFDQWVAVGPRPVQSMVFRPVSSRARRTGARGSFDVKLRSSEGLEAHLSYEWDGEQPLLFRKAALVNSTQTTFPLLDIELADYRTSVAKADPGGWDFPFF
ncbi:MAG: hypothetical protein HY360_10705 [Verrucomicrobia bacterium]|nr:hypothetical protein [Verrucomicrobiota bacterium]